MRRVNKCHGFKRNSVPRPKITTVQIAPQTVLLLGSGLLLSHSSKNFKRYSHSSPLLSASFWSALLSRPITTASSSSLQIPCIIGSPSPRVRAAITASARSLSPDVRFNAQAIRGPVRPGKRAFMRVTKAGRVSCSDSGSSCEGEGGREGDGEGVGDASGGIMRYASGSSSGVWGGPGTGGL